MKHADMRLDNAKTIFDLVYSGKFTLKELENNCNLCRQAIKNIALKFVEHEVFELNKTESQSCGRPEYIFSVSPKIFSAYVYQSLGRLDVIFINAFADVVDRIFYCFDKELSSKQNFENGISLLLSHPSFKNCVSVYITCQDKYKELLPPSFIIANDREMIINSHINNNEIIVFKFSKDIYASFYGKISTIPKSIDDIKKVVSIDKIYTFKKDDIMLEVINSLKHFTIENMIKRIQN